MKTQLAHRVFEDVGPLRAGMRGGEPSITLKADIANPLIHRLRNLASLSADEIALLGGVRGGYDTFERGQEIVSQGTPSRRARLFASGWACRLRTLSDGRRQIVRLIVPGDIIGLNPEPGPLELCATVALTRTQCLDATVLRTAVVREPERWPGLVEALRRGARAEEGQLLDQIMRLGHQTAYERLAHLLLELHERLTHAGLADGTSFPWPLNQETLGDALGLSVVHMNRTLQQMRRERLLQLHRGRVDLLNPELLSEIADFRPSLGVA